MIIASWTLSGKPFAQLGWTKSGGGVRCVELASVICFASDLQGRKWSTCLVSMEKWCAVALMKLQLQPLKRCCLILVWGGCGIEIHGWRAPAKSWMHCRRNQRVDLQVVRWGAIHFNSIGFSLPGITFFHGVSGMQAKFQLFCKDEFWATTQEKPLGEKTGRRVSFWTIESIIGSTCSGTL